MKKPDEWAVGRRLRAIMSDPVWEPDGRKIKTQEDFASLLGVDYSRLNQWLNGYNFPRVTEMAVLVYKYPGLTFDWIYLGDPSNLPVKLHIRLVALEEKLKVPAARRRPVVAETPSFLQFPAPDTDQKAKAGPKMRRPSRKKAT